MAKEGKLRRYRQRIKQYRQNRTVQTNERKFYQQLVGDHTKITNNVMQKKPNDFGLKYGNKKHNENAEWINVMTRELEGLEEDPKAGIDIDLLKSTLKNIKQENTRP